VAFSESIRRLLLRSMVGLVRFATELSGRRATYLKFTLIGFGYEATPPAIKRSKGGLSLLSISYGQKATM
jgi:hypothetical protein